MNKTKIAVALALTSIVSTNVLATNGYFAHGYGGAEKGLAGAGVAKGQSSVSTANNPANLLQVGERTDLGLSIFSPIRSYSVEGGPSFPSGFSPVIGSPALNCNPGAAAPVCQVPFSTNPGSEDSGREWFAIPSFGISRKIDDKTAWGITAYGNGGMNSDYGGGSARFLNPATNSIVDAPGTFGASKTGVDLSQLFVNTTLAYRVNETLDVGVSVIGAMQRFAAYGLAPFANNSLDPNNLTNKGHDLSFGYGFKIGANLNLSESFTFGASYQTKMQMSKLDDYAGLFAQGGSFDIPATYTVGIAYKPTKSSTLLVDYQRIDYSDVPALGNGIGSLLSPATCTDALNNFLISGNQAATGSGCLGGANGAGFGWEDVKVIKIGYEWTAGDDTYRLGYSTTDQPIPESEVNFNLLAPGVVEDHFTAGYTMKHNKKDITFFVMYAPSVSVSGTSSFDPAQTISFKMHQFEFGIDYQF